MKRRLQAGFTFVELAAVMIISGLLFMGLTRGLSIYNMNLARQQTAESLNTSVDALSEFVATNFRYPCPASLTAAPGSAQYGLEDCAGVQVVTGRGGREVLIGALPVTFLQSRLQNVPLADSHTYDGYGNRLTYAVTRALTNATTYNDNEGAIDVVDEFDQNVLDREGEGHFVLISHGPNGIGAFSREGGEVAPGACNVVATPIPPAPGVTTLLDEIENCDNDAKFLSGLRNLSANNYYDDEIRFSVNRASNLWIYVGPTHVVNTNMGNVGFGVTDPRERLHIDGDLRAIRVGADKVCDSTNNAPEGCMPVAALAGAGMLCPPGQGVFAFENNQARCRSLFPANMGNCPTGQVAVGISASGFICDVLVIPP